MKIIFSLQEAIALLEETAISRQVIQEQADRQEINEAERRYTQFQQSGEHLSRHTPGPWERGKTADSIISSKSKNLGRFGPYADEYYGSLLICESVAPNNRALICAAPELLAICKMLVLERVMYGEASMDTVNEAAAIIKEAGGGTLDTMKGKWQ